MNVPESEGRRCDQCGTPLGRHLRDGLCTRCLARSFPLEREEEDSDPVISDPGPVISQKSAVSGQRTEVEGPKSEVKARFGDYELLEEIAHGGMGVVYRARQISLKRIVAVKMLLCGQFAGKAAFDRFRAEAETVARLQHPNIVAIHAIGETDGQPYFSMDYVAGRNLVDIVRDHPLPAQQAARYVRQIAQAVHYAHTQGVLHRDLKPANVLIDENDEPRVTDFGIARRLTDTQPPNPNSQLPVRHSLGEGGSTLNPQLTLTGQVVGSPNFMPPEQGAGKKAKLGPTGDVYGPGALLYYLVTARPPFVAETFEATLEQVLNTEPVAPRQLNPGLPRDLETICLKCLEKDTARRYASAADLADELNRFLKGEPIHARPIGVIGKGWRWCRRKPAIAGMAAAAMVVVLTVSAIAVWRVERAREQEALERYAANISLANNSIREGSIDLALERLLQCPEKYRHWEWGHLLFECLQEVSTISTYPTEAQWIQTPFVERFDVSADGIQLGSLNRDGILSVWDLLEERELFRVGDETNRVTCYSFRAGTNQIAAARLDGSIVVLDTVTGKQLWSITVPVRAVSNYRDAPIIGVNADIHGETPIRDYLQDRPWVIESVEWAGDRLLTRSVAGQVMVRDYGAGGTPWFWPPMGSIQRATRAWFAPGVSNVVVQTIGEVRVLEAATGTERKALRWDPTAGRVSVSPHGDRAVSIATQADPQGPARLIGHDGLVADLGRLAGRNHNAPLEAFFNADGTLFCTTGDLGTARVFRADTGAQVFALPDSVYGGVFSQEGDRLAVYGQGRIVRVWDVHHGQELRQLRGHLSSIVQVAHSAAKQLWVTASRDGVVKTWISRDDDKVHCEGAVVTTSGFSPDGRWLATGPLWSGVRLYEAATGRLVWERPSRTHSVLGFAFSPDSRLMYTVGSDRCVRIFNVSDGTLQGMLYGHVYSVFPVHCSPDGRYVAAGDSGGHIKVWNARTRIEELSIAAYKDFPQSLMFDCKSRYLLAAGPGNPTVWDVATGRLVTELGTNTMAGWSAAFFPDGRHVVTVGLDHMVRIWEIPSGRLLSSWKGQIQGNLAVSFTPDGLRFASMGSDMSTLGQSLPKLEIWDAQHGRLILTLDPHRESTWQALFDSTGRKLVTASMDTTVRLWESFPWKDANYAEPRSAPLVDRVRHYARNYWRERVTGRNALPSRPPATGEAPFPVGIPEWERDRWPQRDPATGPEQINLDRAYTGVLDAVIFPNANEMEWDDDLAELPRGNQWFGGVRFDVRGVVWLNSDPALSFFCTEFPHKVEGIAVGRRFQKLHVLHAAQRYSSMTPEMGRDSKGNPLPIGAYILRYADGSQHEFEIQYGRDLRHWWWGGRGDSEAEAERAKVVWVGTNATSRGYEAKIRLFMSTFENPRPEVEVVAVDFVSRKTPFAPFLVAITVEP